jgi:glycosyltransferase involved in cell wall biosynthesis
MKAVPGRPVAVISTTISRTADQFYRDIAEALQRQGYRVHVVTSDGPDVLNGVIETSTDVHIIDMTRTISPVADLRALARWVRTLRSIRPELVLAGTPKAGLLGMLASWVTRVPRRVYFLLGLRLESAHGARRSLLSAMEFLASWCSHVVIAVSTSLAGRYAELGLAPSSKIVVPHHGSSHGVDSAHFTPRQRQEGVLIEAGLEPGIPVLTFIGRLTKDKGLDALIMALSRIMDMGDRVQLIVLGAQDEPDSNVYLDRLRRPGMPVAVLDEVADVRPFLSVTDVLVLPTRREGMPNVALEAAAMAIPVVTTDATGAIDSVLDGVTGLVVPVDDAPALALAIHRLINDPRLRARLGSVARLRVVADFQPADVATAIVMHALGAGSHTHPARPPVRETG